ncbi:hypothetical protein BVRB_7g179750 [Beta vulgaris subsp. vulgaris]|uniref:RING-type domain-containing protein n=2 Tax=Beta vulgaris subsp. vulgaris TaxID=3555 RepID=A0A0J8B6V8_BETVV|nr:uncharacterized protein LOC104908920 isoform X2 [Beta vulgaris subsp. vulgaris]XP_010696394.1 uncharacterized protein LOC104908920 isoform X2 [Beta vulgaris subsp. vulgaris]XP_048503985.1 uncharacterized protein LOC104908920 isoform X2 [Beta vulgaris subsp. vulgaris]KMS96994.1 hypothetical protein BVRB_7g179750 [Beta vulgaris subsp. vulgaris]
MSARVPKGVPPKAAVRCSQRRKMGLDVDLNVPLSDHCDEVGTSSHVPAVPQVQAAPLVVPIDVDSLEEDVVLSSPRAFAAAKNNSRRNQTRSSNVADVEILSASRPAANNRCKRQRVPTNQPIINCELYVIPDRNDSDVSGTGESFPGKTRSVAPPPPPPPPEPVFNCPVCMGPLVEEMTTKCGHIFCKACIKKAISSQHRCPTCRRKVTMKDTIRIYLPASS